MVGFFDVFYFDDDTAQGACVLSDSITSSKIIEEHTIKVEHCEPYESGMFYKREMPILFKMIENIGIDKFDLIVVDGYVKLSENHDGLGKHLYDALGCKIPIIGVAKNKFKSENQSVSVTRGSSIKPLFITSVGIDLIEASNNIKNMSGEFRIPTLLKRVDSLSRNN